MPSRLPGRRRLIVAALCAAALPVIILASNRLSATGPASATLPASAVPTGATETRPADIRVSPPPAVDPAVAGHSAKVRVILGLAGQPLGGLEVSGACDWRWREVYEGRTQKAYCISGRLVTPATPGVWKLDGPEVDLPTVLALRPRAEKEAGRLGPYHIGAYRPRPARYTPAYEPPDGFIEVTEANQDMKVSDHFRLRDFLTKDQFDVWPKYLALDMRLIDKLELVLDALRDMGHPVTGFFVMSGYRTPQYNGPGGNGRSGFSRHVYGDAADVWVDETGDGRMDDLNGDGRSDRRDARVILQAVEQVEARHPDLVGGTGLYGPKGARGPFVHIDARGRRARW